MGRTACTEPQCLYKGALYLLVPWSRKSRAIPLLPLWAVRSVHNLSACTRLHFTFTFTFHLVTRRPRGADFCFINVGPQNVQVPLILVQKYSVTKKKKYGKRWFRGCLIHLPWFPCGRFVPTRILIALKQ